jgi:hypothetical protein
MTVCPFCQHLASGDVTEANAHAVAFADGYPVAADHTLVVLRRHVASVFNLAGAASRSRRALRRVPGGRCVAGTAALAGRTARCARTAPGFAPAPPRLAPWGG